MAGLSESRDRHRIGAAQGYAMRKHARATIDVTSVEIGRHCVSSLPRAPRYVDISPPPSTGGRAT